MHPLRAAFGPLALLAACKAPPTPPPERPPDPEADAAWVALSTRIERAMERDYVAGMQVAVVLDGELRYRGAWGTRQYEGDEPVTNDTLFRWASVSKMHTATAVLQLVDDGEVGLDEPITAYIDGLSLDAGFDPSTITPRHLLTHTAALPDRLDWQCNTDDEALGAYVDDWDPPLYAPPGSFYNYSNSGYTWAGALLEQVTGDDYVDLMAERVLEPAGMATATFDAAAAGSGDAAVGTSWWNDAPWFYELAPYDCAPSRPAAWLHGTATDLARTAEWQLAGGGDLLSAELTDAMHAQRDTHFYADGSYEVGMGQFAFPYAGLDVVYHNGWVTGFVSSWAIVPEAGFGVAVVANVDWAWPDGVMYDAIELFLGAEGDTWTSTTTDPSEWAAYAGTYEDPYVYGAIEVSVQNERLYADFVDLDERVLLGQSSGDYFWGSLDDGTEVDVRFIQDESGQYRWFVTRAGVGTRDDAPPGRPAALGRPVDAEAGRAALLRHARPPDGVRRPRTFEGLPPLLPARAAP